MSRVRSGRLSPLKPRRRANVNGGLVPTSTRDRQRLLVRFVIRGERVSHLGIDLLSMLPRLGECRGSVWNAVADPPAVALPHVIRLERTVAWVR